MTMLYNHDMEVVLGGSIQISTSPRKYDKFAHPLEVSVKEVHNISDIKCVLVMVKVVDVGD